jgi:deazaflavin-dependent oxidoreductase (nitroreductase family)
MTATEDWSSHAMSDELVAWGRVIELETTGRRSGRPRRVAVGWIERSDGALGIAATDPDTHWALNLLAEARCRVRDEHGWRDCRASPLEDEEHDGTIAALILRYGTPAERLGLGPTFRLDCGPSASRSDEATGAATAEAPGAAAS